MPDMKLLDDEFQSLMQSIGCVHVQPPKAEPLNKSSETAPELKKLSFTERLELYERDVLNGFTADLPVDVLSQSQQCLSQESIELSDDEINYSMCNGATRCPSRSANDDHVDRDNPALSSPIELDSPDSSTDRMDFEQTLINQSVCNIFEKTFEQSGSPVQVNRKKLSKATTLKKFQSETVLSPRYGCDAPSTSSTANHIHMTPVKKTMQSSPQQKHQCSPISPPPIEETRMDISNDDYYIRIGLISSKPNYEQMDASTLEMELRTYGLKPSLSRRQAIICLDYIYNCTHPLMDSADDDLYDSLKTSKYSSTNRLNAMNEATPIDSSDNNANSNDPQIDFNVGFAAQNLVDEKFKCREAKKIFLPSMPRAKVRVNGFQSNVVGC